MNYPPTTLCSCLSFSYYISSRLCRRECLHKISISSHPLRHLKAMPTSIKCPMWVSFQNRRPYAASAHMPGIKLPKPIRPTGWPHASIHRVRCLILACSPFFPPFSAHSPPVSLAVQEIARYIDILRWGFPPKKGALRFKCDIEIIIGSVL